MVAKNIRLPNIRRMFVPDPGYTIVDADLAGADAQVVAWEANDRELMEAFRQGLKVHVYNSRTMYPEITQGMTDDEIKKTRLYKENKIRVHATNYGASPPALVANTGCTLKEAQEFQAKWFSAHPAIREWHKRYERYLLGLQCWNCDNMDLTLGRPCQLCGAIPGRTIKNRFGFRIIYYDRPQGILPQALGWTPQSTVNFSVELGWINMVHGHQYAMQMNHAQRRVESWEHFLVSPNAKEKWGHIVKFLIQVHDSIVFQIPHAYEDDVPEIVHDLQVKVPYNDELIIPLGVKMSRKSWGDCE